MRTRAVIEVPYLDDDVHDLDGLVEINRYLFAADGAERAGDRRRVQVGESHRALTRWPRLLFLG